MSDENTITAANVVQSAIEQNPTEFGDNVTSIINSRVGEFINNKREEISKDYFTPEQEPDND